MTQRGRGGAEVSGRHLLLGPYKLHKTVTDLQPGATEGIMVDIDGSSHTNIHPDRHKHTSNSQKKKKKSNGTIHFLPIKILHGAHEVIMIAKQVLLPELPRTKFPDWSVWTKVTCSAGQQTSC